MPSPTASPGSRSTPRCGVACVFFLVVFIYFCPLLRWSHCKRCDGGRLVPQHARPRHTVRVPAPQGLSVVASRGPEGLVLEYNAHSLFGMTMAKATFEAVEVIKRQRPFVVSRCACAV